jgi:hypothetical protein
MGPPMDGVLRLALGLPGEDRRLAALPAATGRLGD